MYSKLLQMHLAGIHTSLNVVLGFSLFEHQASPSKYLLAKTVSKMEAIQNADQQLIISGFGEIFFLKSTKTQK